MNFACQSGRLYGYISYSYHAIAIDSKLSTDGGVFGARCSLVFQSGYVCSAYAYLKKDGNILWYVDDRHGESAIYDHRVPLELREFTKSLIESTQAWLKAGPPLPEGCLYTQSQ